MGLGFGLGFGFGFGLRVGLGVRVRGRVRVLHPPVHVAQALLPTLLPTPTTPAAPATRTARTASATPATPRCIARLPTAAAAGTSEACEPTELPKPAARTTHAAPTPAAAAPTAAAAAPTAAPHSGHTACLLLVTRSFLFGDGAAG